MPLTLKQFVQQLTSIDLVSADELQPLVDRFAERDAKAAERVAKELIRDKKLTAFQAQAALQGKAKNLVLGNYLILEKLGQGGMGMVLKARHKRMDRVVALKILSAKALQSPDAVKRFAREVQAAAKLHHPNIVTAFDADEAHGTHFLVMEYVEGKNLSALVKEQGRLPVEQAVDCVLQAARGLEYAHGKGIVHRDIKPANLLLDPDGVMKILDMGLARLENVASGDSELTGTGQIMGTVDYMAPEQAVSTKNADQRADIYSLGITLWYLLTGRMAYEGDTLMAKLVAHREQPIPSLLPTLSGGPQRPVSASAARLNDVFQKMVAKRPEGRYPSMTHLIADLVRCQTSQAGPPTIAVAPDQGSKLGAFLRGGNQGAAAAQVAARPAPPVHLQETLITSGPQGDTDPETNVNLGGTAFTFNRARKPNQDWMRDWRIYVGAMVSVVGLLVFFTIIFVVGLPFGEPERQVAQVPAKNSQSHGTLPGTSPPERGDPIDADKRWVFADWKPLFDGESLAGWSGDQSLATVENGVIVTAARSGTVIAPGVYRDFVVDIEFRLANGGNSGVGLFYAGQGIPAYSGIEVQFLDDVSYANFGPDQRCGSLYSLAAAQGGHFRRWPEWNKLRVTALGPDLKVSLNDVEVVSAQRPDLERAHPQHEGLARRSGPICLAPHTGRCEYRNFYIREATWTAAPSAGGGNRPAQEGAAAYNGHSYKYYAQQLSWKEAQARCEGLGGHLVVIDTIAENQFVAGQMSKAGALDAWIGITDEAAEGTWRTVTGQRQIYTNWSSEQPNNQGAGEHFALISNRTLGNSSMAWMWADQPNRSGTFSPGFVCEWDALPMSGG